MLLEEEIKRNNIKTAFVFLLFFIFIGVLSYAIGYMWGGYYIEGIVFGLIFSLVYCIISILYGKNMVLRIAGSRPLEKEDYPFIWHTVEALSVSAGIPKPEIYILDTKIPNAFATGFSYDKSAIALTTGLIEKLNREELEGVIAHELAHIKNYDIRSSTIAIALGAVIILLGNIIRRSFRYGRYMSFSSSGSKSKSKSKSSDRKSSSSAGQAQAIIFLIAIVIAILSPFISKAIQMAISRRREYQADATAVKITGYPEGLASALEKISDYPVTKEEVERLGGDSVIGLYIHNPLNKIKYWSSTHPPIEDRIQKLRNMI